MGNVLSGLDSPADQLFRFEEKILNAEAHLIKLRRRTFPKSLMFLSISAVLIVSFLANLRYLYIIILLIITSFLVFLSSHSVNNRRIRMAEYNLKKLKENQRKFVNDCKDDISFSKTRRLIQKYEDEESRESFFKTVIQRRRTGMDKIADFVLANDPAKMNALICTHCGQHNGLIDPSNKEIEFFYCYSCKEKNIRKFSEIGDVKNK